MNMIQLGRSGLMVSELCLGSMTWGNRNSAAEGHAQIDTALDHGVNFIDTAEMYPVNPVAAETAGRSEEVIGSWFAKTRRRGDVVIASKITGAGQPAVRNGAPITKASLRAALEGSLRRLQTEVIDLYQLHWPNRGSYHFRQLWEYDPTREQDTAAILDHMAEVLETLQSFVNEGKILHFGLSNESAWGMANWLRIAAEAGGPPAQSIQNEYSLLCRTFDGDLAELCAREGVTLLAFSPLAAGILSGKYQGDVTPKGSRREGNPNLSGRLASHRVFDAVAAYHDVARAHGLDPCQMALAFVRSRPVPTIPIFGAVSAAQLDLALGSAEVTLTPELRAALSAVYRAHPMPY